jgi:hypothetical protein
MPKLELDANHIYTVDGRRVDGLTSTIQEAGLIRSSGSYYMDRGSKIHLATQYWDEGVLDEETVDPQIQGYLDSWKQFRKDQHYTPIEIEYKISNPILLVASTVDRIPLLDIKSGGPEPWHILQIAFQWKTLLDTFWDMQEYLKTPMDVYLDPDGGPPKVKAYKISELKEAYQVYCSLLVFLRWKREKGIKHGNL